MDHAALADAVQARGLRVALDVFPDEPSAGTASYRAPIVALPQEPAASVE